MQLEQVKPNKPSFGLVVLLAGVAIVVIFIAAAIIIGWRSHKKNAPPYNKHPDSRLYAPERPGAVPAQRISSLAA